MHLENVELKKKKRAIRKSGEIKMFDNAQKLATND